MPSEWRDRESAERTSAQVDPDCDASPRRAKRSAAVLALLAARGGGVLRKWAEREEETPSVSRETQGFSIPASQITSQSHTKGCRDALRRIAAVSQIPRRTGALHNDREADGGRARAIERRRRGPSSATPTSARRSHSAQSSASRLRVMGQVHPGSRPARGGGDGWFYDTRQKRLIQRPRFASSRDSSNRSAPLTTAPKPRRYTANGGPNTRSGPTRPPPPRVLVNDPLLPLPKVEAVHP